MQIDEKHTGILELLKMLESAMMATINHGPKENLSEIDKAIEDINQTLGKNYTLIDIAKLIFILRTLYPALHELMINSGQLLIQSIAQVSMKAKEDNKDKTVN